MLGILGYGRSEFLCICSAVKPNFHEKAYQGGPKDRDAVRNVNARSGTGYD